MKKEKLEMKSVFKKIFNKNEKGIALLFTLGMLSLLLVLALSFASNSKIENRISSNMDNRTAARYLAQSALNRTIGAMSYYMELCKKHYETNPTDPPWFLSSDDIVSHNNDTVNDSANVETFDYIYLLNTKLNGQVVYDKIVAGYTKTDTKMPNWIYVHEGNTVVATKCTDKIIGRFAYVVAADKAGIDPSVTAISDETNDKARLGVNVNEINLKNLDTSMTELTSANIAKTAPDRWSDLDSIFNKLGMTATDAATITKKQKFTDWFVTTNPPDPEAFWIDNQTTPDGYKSASELYHRFNLLRTDWDTVTVDTLIAAALPYSSTLSPNAINPTNSGIEWLARWTTDAGGMVDATACKKQIAANIINYCATPARSAVSDITTNPTAPTYVGLKKCPYINEVNVKIEGSVAETPIDATNSSYLPSVNISDVVVELVNMYSSSGAVSTTASGVVAGEYNWSLNGVSQGTVSIPDVSFSMAITVNPSTYNKNNQTFSIPVSPGSAVTSAKSKVGTINVRITKLYVKLEGTASVLYDFSNIETDSGFQAANTIRYFDYEVDDPRQNTKESDWVMTTGTTDATGSCLGVGGARKNAACNPNPGGAADLETGAADPWEVSTAYIREPAGTVGDPLGMRSPWELGSIHRGKKWQTLNIHKYNSVATGADAGVKPSDYAAGDGNILDMVKMTPDLSTYGKINLNIKTVDVLRALFQNIYVGGTYTAPTGGTALNATNAGTLASAVITASNTAFSFKRRSQVINTAGMSDNTLISRTNKRMQDEFIGKFINLTKAENVNEFTIIVVAQSIKDIGPATIAKDLNHDGALTTNLSVSSNTLPFYYDKANALTLTNASGTIDETAIPVVKGTYMLGADEILATQKIMATVVYDTINKKFKITKFQYLSQ